MTAADASGAAPRVAGSVGGQATAATCPACGEGVDAVDAFCESCGAGLGGPAALPRPVASAPGFVASGGASGGDVVCGRCLAPIDAQGYCTSCGLRQAHGKDHVEVDLGAVAAVSDKGLRHHRNEDAVRLAYRGRRAVVVVCDGVSSTANPDRASAAASDAAMAALESLLDQPEWPAAAQVAETVTRAVGDAQQAAAGVEAAEPGGMTEAPSTTLVAVVSAPGTITVANIGDSRAYWLAPGANRLLTVDDSVAEAARAEGVPAEVAYSAPDAHVITRWLGADSADPFATLTTVPVDEAGTVVVCSDGLWNYAESPDRLATLVAGVAGMAGGAGMA
nr:protein phosphatase 2C domain-containing protein [Actinomycetota bacterium]